MRVVDPILSRLKQARRDDPIFGSMLYMGDRLRSWEGKAAFPPTDSTIEVFVDGSADDSMEQQHKFFRRILQEWPTLGETVGRFLLEQWHQRESGIRVESPWVWFRISSLCIPNGEIDDATWEISFAIPSDLNQLWTVHMKGLLPNGSYWMIKFSSGSDESKVSVFVSRSHGWKRLCKISTATEQENVWHR